VLRLRGMLTRPSDSGKEISGSTRSPLSSAAALPSGRPAFFRLLNVPDRAARRAIRSAWVGGRRLRFGDIDPSASSPCELATTAAKVMPLRALFRGWGP
jgi:hypothetical protein